MQGVYIVTYGSAYPMRDGSSSVHCGVVAICRSLEEAMMHVELTVGEPGNWIYASEKNEQQINENHEHPIYAVYQLEFVTDDNDSHCVQVDYCKKI